MNLLAGLGLYFLGAFALALAYQLVRRRRLTVALHYAVVFGLAVTMAVFVLAVALDLANITPEPTPMSAAPKG